MVRRTGVTRGGKTYWVNHSKKFNGKTFNYVDWYRSRKSAEERAKRLRSHGFQARIYSPHREIHFLFKWTPKSRVPNYRMIGGKRFRLYNVYPTKKKATAKANKLRKEKGYNIRMFYYKSEPAWALFYRATRRSS